MLLSADRPSVELGEVASLLIWNLLRMALAPCFEKKPRAGPLEERQS